MYFDFLTFVGPAMIVAVLVFQVIATFRVKRDVGSSPEQKGMQLRLIWFLPLIGAALVLAVLHDEPRPTRSARITSQSQPAPPIGGDAGRRKGPNKDA